MPWKTGLGAQTNFPTRENTYIFYIFGKYLGVGGGGMGPQAPMDTTAMLLAVSYDVAFRHNIFFNYL